MKQRIASLVTAFDGGLDAVRTAMSDLMAPGAVVHLAHPFETLVGPQGLVDEAFAPLFAAIPDLERRDMILMQGTTPKGADWVGVCGHYAGRFDGPFLGIPGTGRMVAMRYHEFYRFEGGRCVEVQALWDLPELMMQAGVWPLAPALGRSWQALSPITQDGLAISGDGTAAMDVVIEMLTHLRYNNDGVDAMRLDAFWHPHCSWYGPAGIGTARGIHGFRKHHQIPFLDAMPDRVGDPHGGHAFAQGDYVGFTAWPGMHMTLTGGGWLGMPTDGQRITMRSLDFWRVQDGMIRENWVLVDLLDVYNQLGVDVLARMRELQ
ncbi:MAG: ester cyclase [Paracoccaceae bacterium]|nr:ester cyclase [Paracoccaceae bacterium]MDG2451874.1 ester cyclase [Paracoccaceae bacterium]